MSSLHVVFRVADAEFALPVAEVLYMESFREVTPVPGAPPYVAGVVPLRGRVVPVVSVRARFGSPEIEPDIDSRILVVQVGDRPIGLLVDSAREVVEIPQERIRPPPPLLGAAGRAFVKSVAELDARLLLFIDPALVADAEQEHAE